MNDTTIINFSIFRGWETSGWRLRHACIYEVDQGIALSESW
ncbi:hypothetical protein [Celeribacter sp.]